ncbi:MAG: hypothetical protein RSC17_07695 [Lachnospiraceae bacterium]
MKIDMKRFAMILIVILYFCIFASEMVDYQYRQTKRTEMTSSIEKIEEVSNSTFLSQGVIKPHISSAYLYRLYHLKSIFMKKVHLQSLTMVLFVYLARFRGRLRDIFIYLFQSQWEYLLDILKQYDGKRKNLLFTTGN